MLVNYNVVSYAFKNYNKVKQSTYKIYIKSLKYK